MTKRKQGDEQEEPEQQKAKRKRRGHGEGTIFLRKDGRWEASLKIEETGKRKSVYGKTRKEVADKLDKVRQEQKQGILATGPQQKFKDYLEQWFEDVQKPTLRPSSIERYQFCIYKHILPALGHVQLQKLTAQQIQSFYNSKRKAGMAPESVITLHKVIHKALDNAVRWRLVSHNVSDNITLPHGSERKAQALTIEQVHDLLNVAKGHELEAMIILLLDTGMRHGEAIALRWDDLDLEKRTMSIHRTVSRLKQGQVEGSPKTESSERTITLSASVVPALKAHRAKQNERKLRAGEKWHNLNLVFPSRTGRHLEKINTIGRFHALLEQVGLPRIRIHDLRHTAITLMMEMGLNQKAIQERVGHTDMKMTWKYTHVSQQMQEEITSRMESILWRQNTSF